MKKIFMWVLLLCMTFLLWGCGPEPVPEVEPVLSVEPVQTVSSNHLADSLDRAVIQDVDEKNRRITLYSLAAGRSYTLTYDNATGIKDRYDGELVVAQLKQGDVAQVSFMKDTKKAKNIWLDKTVTEIENITQFEINRTALWMNVGETRYAIDGRAAVLKPEKLLSLIDINEADTLTIYVDDRTICSIVISNEHGYVRLSGAESFVGGFVEFGQSVIRKVEEDMLVVLPSGSYDMFISYEKNAGTKKVDVLPGEETLVDVSDLVHEEEQREGGIIFTITPTAAILKIDGEETDYSSVVNLSYGIHQIIAACDGYKTITQYIKVGQEMANINIEMEKSSNASPSGSVSSNSTAATTSTGYRVYVDAPVGAELYVEGKYIGLIPASFDKKTGSYMISVRKSGYKTRSYSLEVDDSEKDVHYSFSELELSFSY